MVGAEYIVIEHIGSTSVLGPAAKPNIDIIIEVPNAENAEKAKEALIYEPPAAEHYKCYGDGGIRGRISMKLADRSLVPDQSVYVFSDTIRTPMSSFLFEHVGASSFLETIPAPRC